MTASDHLGKQFSEYEDDVAEHVPLSELSRFDRHEPHANEPPGYQDAVTHDIAQHGVEDPVTIDLHGNLGGTKVPHFFDGSHRYRAAEKLGLKSLPAAVMTHLNEHEEPMFGRPSQHGLKTVPGKTAVNKDRWVQRSEEQGL